MSLFTVIKHYTKLFCASRLAHHGSRFLSLWLFSIGMGSAALGESTGNWYPFIGILVLVLFVIGMTAWRWLIAMFAVTSTVGVLTWRSMQLSTETWQALVLHDNSAWYTWLTAVFLYAQSHVLVLHLVGLAYFMCLSLWLRIPWQHLVIGTTCAWLGWAMSIVSIAPTAGGHGLGGILEGLGFVIIMGSIPATMNDMREAIDDWHLRIMALATWALMFVGFSAVSAPMPSYFGGTIGGVLAGLGLMWWGHTRKRETTHAVTSTIEPMVIK